MLHRCRPTRRGVEGMEGGEQNNPQSPNQPYMPTYIRQPGTLLQQANRLLGRPPPSFIWSRSTINHIKVGVSRSTSFSYASGKLSHFGQPSNTPTSITWDAKPWKQHPLGCNRKHEHTNCAWTQSPSRCVLITNLLGIQLHCNVPSTSLSRMSPAGHSTGGSASG